MEAQWNACPTAAPVTCYPSSKVAARIGGSREMVSRIMRDLTQGGYIELDAKRIRVLKKLPAHW